MPSSTISAVLLKLPSIGVHRVLTARLLSSTAYQCQKLALDKSQTPDINASPLFQSITDQALQKKLSRNSGLPEGTLRLDQVPQGTTYISKHSYVQSTGNIQYSPQKLNKLARQIKGLPLTQAIAQMRFGVQKPCAMLVRKLNEILKNTADVQFGDPSLPDRGLVIAQAWVGKGLYQHGLNIHGRGRFGKLTSPTSHMKILVKVANVKLAPNRGNRHQGKGGFLPPKKMHAKVKEILPNKPIYNKWKKLFFDA